LKREVVTETEFLLPEALPHALAVVIPDLAKREFPRIEDLLFFDLETTGLSGGAGTLAFLAAFGRIASGGKMLKITQYLLLDYPGENDFLEAVLKEFGENSVTVSFNGKCFDSQIIKTRCLVNRIMPPLFKHADLLHPARRLWKNIIGECSQGSIETKILGIDRTGDTPGALAPDIWFEFLKTGRIDRLTGICDHNICDISGLSRMLAAMVSVADNPLDCNINYDIERLALFWRKYLRKHDGQERELIETGEKLLRITAEKQAPLCVYVYSTELIRRKNYNEALKFVKLGLRIFQEGSACHDKLLRKNKWLEKKIMREISH
jgi:uncharacterized protein YprB with RNaseH-like and TPR domain